MEKEFVLTQTKVVTMTMDKTVTEVSEQLDRIDLFGRRETVAKNQSCSVKFHDNNKFGRAA